MTAQYQQLVESIFGVGSMPPSSPVARPNEITGALASSTFQTFNANFVSRLHRLNGLWGEPDNTRSSLLTQVKNIAGTEWPGAYAELCAYDFFGQSDNWARRGLGLDVNLPSGSTYSHLLGKPGPANVDIHFEFFDVYSDVKCLKNNLKELVDGVIKEATRHLGNLPRMSNFECRLDLPYEGVKQNRNILVSELRSVLEGGDKPLGVRSAILPELYYRFVWTGNALVTTGSYNAYRHAESHFARLYQYANKFTMNHPFLLTMVSFPWFNGTITDFNGSNEAFYRSTARRAFFQYRNATTPFSDMDSRFTGTETVFDVSKKIAALIFLEDCCILGAENTPTKVHAYIYLNPLADHRSKLTLFEDYLSDLRGVVRIDDFEYDNY